VYDEAADAEAPRVFLRRVDAIRMIERGSSRRHTIALGAGPGLVSAVRWRRSATPGWRRQALLAVVEAWPSSGFGAPDRISDHDALVARTLASILSGRLASAPNDGSAN